MKKLFNIEDKYADMKGAEGGFDRRELRDLRQRKRAGQLSRGQKERLEYLQKVNRGKLAKGAAIAGLAATALVAAPAVAGAIGSGASGGGASGLAAAMKSGKLAKGVKAAKSAKELMASVKHSTGSPDEPIVIRNGGRLPYKVIKKRK